MRHLPWARSLRLRLLAATLVAVAVALALAGLLLSSLFREHVMQQFSQGLVAQLDQITARLEFDAAGQPQLDTRSLTDPRFFRPYSGLYWQVDGSGPGRPRGVLRSRSLWDATLQLPADELAHGQVHVHEGTGPGGAGLLLVERTITRDEGPQATPWRMVVGSDLRDTAQAVDHFNGVLAGSLAGLLGLLVAAALAQVAIGLAPLRALQRRLSQLRAGTVQRLEGHFPLEVQPLIDDFNAVMDRNAEVVARARTQAGNLAHAIKTPLTALSHAAAVAQSRPETRSDLAALVEEQVAMARRQVDWHLARARAAAASRQPGARVVLGPVLTGLLRVMERVHAERGLVLACSPLSDDLAFAGEMQDLQEILGNLLDNACKWARHHVRVEAGWLGVGSGRPLKLTIEDDGPGIAEPLREAAMARGARLDESVPGSGLGLAIANELVGLYGGRLHLAAAASGGLRAEIVLPGA